MVDPKSKVISYKDLPKIRRKAKKVGKKIVFLTGFFDLFHAGHAAMLTWAKKQGDILIIGLGPDDAGRTWKGKGRPVYPEQDRAYVLACHHAVDYILILREPITPDKINFKRALKLLRPDILLAVNTDSSEMQKIRRQMAKEIGAKLKLFGPFPHRRTKKPSTTEAIVRIRKYG